MPVHCLVNCVAFYKDLLLFSILMKTKVQNICMIILRPEAFYVYNSKQ